MIYLSSEYISSVGGLNSAISLKSVEILRDMLGDLTMPQFEFSLLSNLKYLLLHNKPHIDEYLASLIFRACLPDRNRKLAAQEIILTSANDDHVAQAIWPHAAVFGIGGTYSGGAQALFKFDEHVLDGLNTSSNSLAMLIKRKMLCNQQAPRALYLLLNEVDSIDTYGGAHPKNLATYIKNLHNMPLINKRDEINETQTSEYMHPTSKLAVVDACLISLLLGLKDENSCFSERNVWFPALRQSLQYFEKNTLLKTDPLFNEAYRRVYTLLISVFDQEVKKGKTCLSIVNENGERVLKTTKGGQTTKQYMLIPYLPVLCYRHWGIELGQAILMPLWETRVAKEIMHIRAKRVLKTELGSLQREQRSLSTSIGKITILHANSISIKLSSEAEAMDLKPWVIDYEATSNFNSASSINAILHQNNFGFGFTIFRDPQNGVIVLTKGASIPKRIWECVCSELIRLEGSSSASNSKFGCWHITRNPTGIADFLLNGNPSHQYVTKSAITADSLITIINMISDEQGTINF